MIEYIKDFRTKNVFEKGTPKIKKNKKFHPNIFFSKQIFLIYYFQFRIRIM